MINRLLDLLPKHSVGMSTDYRTVTLLNYAVEPQVLHQLVPAPLDLDLACGSGWVTVVCADMVRMRPAPLPRLLGITYDQVVYRVPVRYRDEPGLFFLGSDAGQPLMVAAGAAFSMFRVRLSRTRITDAGDRVSVDVLGREGGHDLHAFLKLAHGSAPLPDGSAFGSPADAQAFLVDRFVAFVPGADGRPMRRVRVRRGTWDVLLPTAVDVRSDLLDGSPAFPVGTARLDHTFVARDIPYHWHPAEVELGPGRWRRPRAVLLVRDRARRVTDRRGTLLFDQDCGICTATAGWLGRRVEPARLGLLGIGSVDADPRVAALVEGRALAASLHFVRADGAVLTGARAVLAAGRLVPRWRVLAMLVDHRPGHIVLEPLYRLVAVHRQRIGRLLGLPQTCAIPPRVRDPRTSSMPPVAHSGRPWKL